MEKPSTIEVHCGPYTAIVSREEVRFISSEKEREHVNLVTICPVYLKQIAHAWEQAKQNSGCGC